MHRPFTGRPASAIRAAGAGAPATGARSAPSPSTPSATASSPPRAPWQAHRLSVGGCAYHRQDRRPHYETSAATTLTCTGLVRVPGRPRHRATGTPLSAGAAPNDLWCADFKGEFKLGNGRYCYPLTVTDHASRFLLLCEALGSTREDTAVTAFEQLFRERGLPRAIRSDNGVPFASPNGLFDLSKAGGLVAPARHRHRAHQAGAPAAERPPRAPAPHPQAGGDPPARRQQPAAAGPLRCLRPGVQHRAASRGPRHEAAGRTLLSLAERL